LATILKMKAFDGLVIKQTACCPDPKISYLGSWEFPGPGKCPFWLETWKIAQNPGKSDISAGKVHL
jgi:hypothetical protein